MEELDELIAGSEWVAALVWVFMLIGVIATLNWFL